MTPALTDSNIPNRTLWAGDNLDVMRGMNSETIDLIYLDPPFNSSKEYAASENSPAAGASFNDTWSPSGLDESWAGLIAGRCPVAGQLISTAGLSHGENMQAYLTMMAVRIIEMRRLLKDTGSIYLHCDAFGSHYIKLLMDGIFGQEHFRREIIWDISVLSGYKTAARNWVRGHDTILYYSKTGRCVFNRVTQPHRQEYIDLFNKTDGDGRKYFDRSGQRRYLDDVLAAGKAVGDVWTDVMSFQQMPTAREYFGYPTQKPLALLDRIIRASSNEGDVVLDPFCGCATACVAADHLGRRWTGIDISARAIEIATKRLQQAPPLGIGPLFYHSYVTVRTDIPCRTDGEDAG